MHIDSRTAKEELSVAVSPFSGNCDFHPHGCGQYRTLALGWGLGFDAAPHIDGTSSREGRPCLDGASHRDGVSHIDRAPPVIGTSQRTRGHHLLTGHHFLMGHPVKRGHHVF